MVCCDPNSKRNDNPSSKKANVNKDKKIVKLTARIETSAGRYNRFKHFIRCVNDGNIDDCRKLLRIISQQGDETRVELFSCYVHF